MPVTVPPVIYDLASPARDAQGFGYIGPFEYTSPNRQYTVLRCGVFGTSQIRVYKSLNSGQSWAIMDQANGPPDSTNYKVEERNGILHIFWQPNAGGALHYKPFDTATDTWGIAVTVGAPSPALGVFRTALNTSTGDIAILFQALTGGGFAYLRYNIFSAGAFGTDTDFTTGTANKDDNLKNLVIDPNHVVHVIYRKVNTITTASNFIHRTLTFAGVIGSEDIIDTGSSAAIYRSMILGTKIILVTEDGGNLPAVYVAPDYNTPVWGPLTTIAVGPIGFSEGFGLTSLDGLTAYYFWIVLDYSDPLNVIDRLYYQSTTDGVTWADPILMYDAVTNPQLEDPSELPTDQDLHTLSVTQLLNGTFGIYTALEENGFCAGYALLDDACNILFTPVAVAGVVTMPPASQAHYSEPVIAYEVGGETMVYTITPPAPPTVTHIDGGMINVQIAGQGTTTYTTTGPVTTDSGIVITGQPVYPTYQTPVVQTVRGHVRLFQ